MAGGNNGSINFASVLTFFPGTEAWISLTSLPRSLYGARALIIGGRLRLTGGRDDGGAYRSEVRRSSLPWTFVHLPLEPDYQVVLHDQIRYWSTIRIPGTPGSRLAISQLAEHFIPSWLLGLSMLPAWQVKNKYKNFFCQPLIGYPYLTKSMPECPQLPPADGQPCVSAAGTQVA